MDFQTDLSLLSTALMSASWMLSSTERKGLFQDNHKTISHVSNQKQAKMTSGPERTILKQANPSILKTFCPVKLSGESVEVPEEIQEAAMESDTKDSPFKRDTRLDPVLVVNPSTSDPPITPELNNARRKINKI